MLFKEVIGHKHIKEHLTSMVRENRVSHAMLFTGANGFGTMPMALAYAQYVNCLNPGADDACGECSSCKKMARLIHPDFHFVFPVIKRNNPKPVCNDYLDE